ncbi:hypothetical protein [Pedobacter duraquae]|uniref:Uncharacterized protein n=1 Tax=Pedobacter duraquae TaxID=425511 RepID=A0A4R6IHA6_9SPHI|nr:hypothetical protein [Pedobacter duraquae]TDO21271.1 hypothetical protein CLV32_2375 [Pedobacter duraquae]
MNIDELKAAWREDKAPEVNILTPQVIGRTSSAITKVRANMRNEFIGSILCSVILIWFSMTNQKTPLILNLTSIMLFTLLFLTAFYYFKFYTFYKSVGLSNLNLKESLSKAAYDLELNIELYKTYNFCITPLALIVSIIVIGRNEASDYIIHTLSTNLSIKSILIISVVMLGSFVITYFFITMHVKYSYTKYLAELKEVLNDLNAG